jgi:hypothetical protein
MITPGGFVVVFDNELPIKLRRVEVGILRCASHRLVIVRPSPGQDQEALAL